MLRAARRFIEEVRRASTPRAYDYREQLVLWDFRSEGSLQQWDCLCDGDEKGFSRAVLEPNGKGSLWHTRVLVLKPLVIASIFLLYLILQAQEQYFMGS